ncbi:hypothetical protein Tcan_00405, partial [Toxocara canis]
PTFNSILLVIAISTSAASVILYVGVFAVSRKHANLIFLKDQQSLSAFEQRQRQLTATMGLSCIFTLVLYVLPVCTKIILDNSVSEYVWNILDIYAAISQNLNPLSNIIIILLRHHDISERIMHLIPHCVIRLV